MCKPIAAQIALAIKVSYLQTVTIGDNTFYFFMPTSLESNIFLIEALIERLNDDWKVSALENGHVHSYKLTYDVAKRFIKVWRHDVYNGLIA